MPEKECNKTACCAAWCLNECSIVRLASAPTGHVFFFQKSVCLLDTRWVPGSLLLWRCDVACTHSQVVGLIKVADENGSPAKKETLTVGGKGKEESRRADSRTPKSSRTGSKWAG